MIIESKIKDFKEKTKTKKSIIPVLVSSYGSVQNQFFKAVIAKEITLFDLMKD